MRILHNSLCGTVLILAILLARGLTFRKLPKNTFCVLWTAAALRLVLPGSVASKFSIFTLLQGLMRRKGVVSVSAYLAETQAGIGSAAPAAVSVLSVLYLAGVCVFAGFFLFSYLRSMVRFRKAVPVRSACLESWMEKSGGFRPARILRTADGSGPLTYGLFRPVILLPETTDWADEEKLSLVLAHEYSHIRRHDCLLKLLFVITLCMHWFNPAVWLLCLLANRDMELACDEKTLRTLGEEHRFAYARMLLNQAERVSAPFSLYSHFGKHGVRTRIAATLKPRRRSVGSAVLACFLVLGTLVVFATSAVSGSAKEESAAAPGMESRLAPLLSLGDMDIRISAKGSDDSIAVTTEDGSSYFLRQGQWFDCQLNQEALARGTLVGYVREGNCVLCKAEADIALICQEPFTCRVAEHDFYVAITKVRDHH